MTENKNMADGVTPESPKKAKDEVAPSEEQGQALEAMVQQGARGVQPPKREVTEESEEPTPDESEASQSKGNVVELLKKNVSELKPGVTMEEIEEDAGRLADLQTSPDDAIRLAAKLGFTKATKEELETYLKASLVPEAKIKVIMDKAAAGLPDKEEINDLTPQEEEAELKKANEGEGGIEELKSLNSEGKTLMERAASGEEIPEKEIEDFEEKHASILDNVKKKFFYGEDSLLRSEDRVKRLLLKPLVTILLITAVAYLAGIASLTRGSTTRIAK